LIISLFIKNTFVRIFINHKTRTKLCWYPKCCSVYPCRSIYKSTLWLSAYS